MTFGSKFRRGTELRICCRAGWWRSDWSPGELFEHFIGLEIIRYCRVQMPRARLRFWQDPDGPEVDWVLEHEGRLLPIEVKYTDRPTERDLRHLEVFMLEYEARRGIVVCTAPRAALLAKKVTAVPWFELPDALGDGA